MRKGIILASIAALAALLIAGVVLATPSPNGPGQPGMSCQDLTASPNGFNTAGFAHAGTVYAGSPGTASLHSNNPHAVSQYDMACFQLTVH